MHGLDRPVERLGGGWMDAVVQKRLRVWRFSSFDNKDRFRPTTSLREVVKECRGSVMAKDEPQRRFP